MNCKRIERLLSQQRDGELSARDADATVAHLQGCLSCRRYRKALRDLAAEAQDLPRPAAPLQGRLRIAERWLGETHSVPAGRPPWPPLRLSPSSTRWAALAAAAMLLTAVLLRSSLVPSAPDRNPPLLARGSQPEVSHSMVAPLPTRGSQIVARNRKKQQLRREPRATSRAEGAHGRPLRETPRWSARVPQGWDAIGERLRRGVRTEDDFVQIPLPRLADAGGKLIAEAVERYQQEAAIVDARLARKISLAVKAIPLSDLLDRLRGDTGIHLAAGRSTADEKVTLFCRELPLRDVMRQLSRPFGYTWLRSGKAGEYRYELVQDLRSQLLEEELRERDRHEALIALERGMNAYREYLDLSPEEARSRARTAPPAEKKLLEHLGGSGWGMVQVYFRLSPQQQAALRDGQELTFSAVSEAGQQPLPEEVERGVLPSLSHRRIVIMSDGVMWGYPADLPQGQPPTTVPGARPHVILQLRQSELGQYSLEGGSGFSADLPGGPVILRDVDSRQRLQGPIAVGVSPSVLRPNNAAAQARLAHDPSLQRRLTVKPEASCSSDLSPGPSPKRGGVPGSRYGMPRPKGASSHDTGGAEDHLPLPASGRGSGGEVNAPKVTTADLLEALHRATGLPIVADYYTGLYPKTDVSVEDARLFDALNRLADAVRLVWRKDGNWLQFRSAAYFQDRLKEVPHRLLARWSAARRERGSLSLAEVLEIATLPDAQLDGARMAEGARECYGLAEWDLARSRMLRPHWRFLAGLAPEQQQEAAGKAGLTFAKLAPGQQQQFIALALGADSGSLVERLSDLAAATIRVEYTPPGGFTWRPSSTAPELTRPTPRATVIRERTPEAALLAAQRIDPAAGPAQIVPTEMNAMVVYTVGAKDGRHAERIVRPSAQQFSTD